MKNGEDIDIEITGTEYKVPSSASGFTWYVGRGEVIPILAGAPGMTLDWLVPVQRMWAPRIVWALRAPRGSKDILRGVRHAPYLGVDKAHRFVLHPVTLYIHGRRIQKRKEEWKDRNSNNVTKEMKCNRKRVKNIDVTLDCNFKQNISSFNIFFSFRSLFRCFLSRNFFCHVNLIVY